RVADRRDAGAESAGQRAGGVRRPARDAGAARTCDRRPHRPAAGGAADRRAQHRGPAASHSGRAAVAAPRAPARHPGGWADARLRRAAFYPTLTLSANPGLLASSLGSLVSYASRVWSAGPSLSETIFDGGRRRAQLEQTRAAYDGTVAAYRQTVLSAFQEVE